MSAANLAFRFLLELATLAALGYWGASAGGAPLPSWVLAVCVPLAAALLWGAFVSPKARALLPPAARLGIEIGIFVSAIIGLAAAGAPRAASALAIGVALHQGWRAAETLWRAR